MFYLNAIVKVFGFIILILNLSNCDKPTDKESFIELDDDSTISDPLLKNRNKLNFKEFGYLLSKKKPNCCSCDVNNCVDNKNNPLSPLSSTLSNSLASPLTNSLTNALTSSLASSFNSPLKMQTNNLFQNKDTIQIVDRHMDDNSREETRPNNNNNNNNEFDVTLLDDKLSQNNPKKRFKLDMSASIRNFVNQLRPQSPLHAFGVNGNNLNSIGLSSFNQMNYAPVPNYSYGYRPLTSLGLSGLTGLTGLSGLSGLGGINYGLDISPGYSDHHHHLTPISPYVNHGLGSSLSSPYGTGLGLGSSFGIYDNVYPSTIASSKSVLRRKLVPSEGVLLLEVEDPLNPLSDGLLHETLPLTSSRNSLNKIQTQIQTVNSNRHSNFGPPKFSIELNTDDSSRDSGLSFYSNSNLKNNLNENSQQGQPNLTKENLLNFEQLSKNPHFNKLEQLRPNLFKSIKIYKS